MGIATNYAYPNPVSQLASNLQAASVQGQKPASANPAPQSSPAADTFGPAVVLGGALASGSAAKPAAAPQSASYGPGYAA